MCLRRVCSELAESFNCKGDPSLIPLSPCRSLTPENAEVLTEISVLYLKINETQKAYDRLAEVVNIERKCTPKGLLALGAILQVSWKETFLPNRLTHLNSP